MRHSASARENELRQLLVSAPLQLVERPRLLQLVQTHRLLAESERCLYFTLQSLADAGVRLQPYEQLFSQMEEKYMQVSWVGCGTVEFRGGVESLWES